MSKISTEFRCRTCPSSSSGTMTPFGILPIKSWFSSYICIVYYKIIDIHPSILQLFLHPTSSPTHSFEYFPFLARPGIYCPFSCIADNATVKINPRFFAAKCGPPPEPPFTQHASYGVRQFDQGTMVSYHCINGYELSSVQGLTKAKCSSVNGTAVWHGPEMICSRKKSCALISFIIMCKNFCYQQECW